MANVHRYGLRFVRAISGTDSPQIFTFPIVSGYAPNTIDGGGGTAVNLNIGDPVRFRQDGTLRLVQTGQDVAGANSAQADYAFGVVVGFPRIIVSNAPRPGSFYTSGTTYSGGIGADVAPLVSIIPAAGNIFEIDTDAVVGAGTKGAALGVVGQTAKIAYSVLTSGTGQPKANPLLGVSTLSTDGTIQSQLLVVGLGKLGDVMDFTASNLTFQVMFSAVQLQPVNMAAIFGAQN